VQILLAHFTFAQLLSTYNFEITISCKHVHSCSHTYTHSKLPQIMYIWQLEVPNFESWWLYHPLDAGDVLQIDYVYLWDIDTCVCGCVYIYIYIYIYIYTHTHTHTHTHQEEIHKLSHCLLSNISKTSK
jgi:hypothetical protein